LTGGFNPGRGNTFPIMLNNNADAVSNNFAGLPEGSLLAVGSRLFRITYAGGTGHDVILEKVNQPPPANAGTYQVDEGVDSVTLTGSGTDPDGDPLTYRWDLDNDGVFETLGQSVTLSTAGGDGPTVLFPRLAVFDAVGASATSTAVVTINNVAPS